MTKKQFMMLFLIPPIIVLALLSIIPLVEVVGLSFQDFRLRRPDEPTSFVGLTNFRLLFSDPRFINALQNSLLWQLITVVGSIALALLFAIILHRRVHGKWKSLVTLLILTPAVIPRVAAAYQWGLMYSPILGVLNYFLRVLGFTPVNFLGDPNIALYAVAFVDIWQWSLLLSVLLLGVIDSLPKAPFEAALMDGAKEWQIYRHIILPMLTPFLATITLVKMVESLRSFDFIYVMTRGGPGTSTETVDLYAYLVGMGMSDRISYASSMSILMLVVTVLIATAAWKGYRRWLKE